MIYCLICKEDVSKDGYNTNYYGMAIHHNYQDSYCGPGIDCDGIPSKQRGAATAAKLQGAAALRDQAAILEIGG